MRTLLIDLLEAALKALRPAQKGKYDHEVLSSPNVYKMEESWFAIEKDSSNPDTLRELELFYVKAHGQSERHRFQQELQVHEDQDGIVWYRVPGNSWSATGTDRNPLVYTNIIHTSDLLARQKVVDAK